MDRSLRVLLVEDSEEDAELVALALKRGGYNTLVTRVDTRASMERALQIPDWDVVVADYSLPDFTLAEALQMYRESRLDVPFLIVSASIIEDAAIEAMRQGAHDFIMKD